MGAQSDPFTTINTYTSVTSSDSNPATTPRAIEPVLAQGQKLAGCYVLQKQVDTGGVGTVWLAHDEVLGRDISLHFLPPQLRSDAPALDEIRKEVKRNRQLIHPNILRVHDLVEEPEFVAISMDSFSGRSLASLLKEKGSLEPAAIRPWIGQLCQTLDDAHKVNLTHRDLAPSNLFIGDGKLVVASFGISRCIQDALGRVLRGSNPRLSYLSPQLADGLLPARTDDVYSLGMLLFELLTGELPFNGGDVLAQIKRVAAPRVSARLAAGRRTSDLPASWDETIAAALRKDAAQRPSSTLEVAGKLESVEAKGAKPEDVSAQKPEPKSAALGSGKVPVASAAETEKPIEVKKPETTGSGSKPSDPAKQAAAGSSEPPPRKAVEILRERAAELARTKSSGSTPAPSPAGEAKAPPPPPVPAEAKATPTILPPVKKDGATEIYPSLYPQRSRGPALALAAGIAIAAIAGAGYYLQRPTESDSGASDDVDIATTEESYASEIRSVNHKTELPAPPSVPEPPSRTIESNPPAPVVAKAEPPRAVEVAAAPVVKPVAAPAPVVVPAIAAAPEPVPAAPTAPPVAAISPTPKPVDSDEILLAANQPGSRKSAQSSKPASAPAAAAPENPADLTPEAVAEKMAAVEKLKEALQASEQSHEGLVKQQQQMESATAEVQKLLDQKSKELAPLRKSTEDLQKTRKQREETQKAAELEAQKAQQLAAEKARLADEAKKALADLDAQNQEKLAAQQKADGEIAALRTTLTEKQQAAAAAAKAASDAKQARMQQQAAIDKAQQDAEQTKLLVAKAMAAETARKSREEAEKMMAEKAKERQRIESEIAAMKKMFDEKMKVLEDAQKAISDVEAKTKDTEGMQKKAEEEALKLLNKPAASGGSKPAAPEKAPAPSAAPVTAPAASALVPSDNPLSQAAAAVAASPAAAPAATLAMKTEPPKVVTPEPEKPAPKSTQGTGLPENSLGMKFVPVGDVQFAIWQTRVKDFEIFAKAVDLRSNAWKGPGFKQAPDHPVVNVTWHEAVAFCKWLTEKERKDGTLPAGQLYRLPTDLEWSKAVGLGEETGRTPEARDMGIPDVYPWGTQWPPPASAGNYTGEETGSDVAIKGYDDSFAWTSPVGSFPPNQLGLYDMGGNVWQWVMDSWNGESKHKVLRGASWYNGALKLSLLSSCRVHAAPDSSTDNYGFRLVRAADSGKVSR